METNKDKSKKAPSGASALDKIRIAIIGVFVLAYGIFVFLLLDKIASDEPYWTRLIFIFSSLEAITFAALGYVFGKEITKKIAIGAERAQKQAQKEAQKATLQWQSERTNGLALAGMIVGAFDGKDPSMLSVRNLAEEGGDDGSGATQFLVKKAKEFYPELM